MQLSTVTDSKEILCLPTSLWMSGGRLMGFGTLECEAALTF